MTYYGQFGLKAGVKFKSTSDYTYLDINNSPKVEDVNTASDIFFYKYISWFLVQELNIIFLVTQVLWVGLTYNNGFINQIDRKFNEVDGNGKSIIDNNGEPVLSSKDASANLSYVSLNTWVLFLGL